jgi:signal transduction histidine kinase/HD-like signal output (HDOD) protein
MSEIEPPQTARLELILQQLDALPTLPSVAMRLLSVTSDDESESREVIELVESDPALTSRVLAMCAAAHHGLGKKITTVDRAVVMLGFEAIRNAVLSIKVFEAFAEEVAGDSENKEQVRGLDRGAFWRHSLAVAIASERIAHRHADLIEPFKPGEAFVCGLLHDMGKLALDHLLPKSYARVVELAAERGANIAEIEKKVVGLDHHTVGKRLAEHWRLPHVIQDCCWLHGTRYEALPALGHRALIGVVGVADLLARQAHIGYSGNFNLRDRIEVRCAEAGLDVVAVTEEMDSIREELERRADAMGLGETPSRALYLESVLQANTLLSRMNERLESQRQRSGGQHEALEAITAFQRVALKPGGGVQDVMRETVASAASVFGEGYYGLLYQSSGKDPWLLNQYRSDGSLLDSRFVEPPQGAPRLNELRGEGSISLKLMNILPWIGDQVDKAVDVNAIALRALPCSWGTAAVLLHDRERLGGGAALEALVHTWGSAIAAATQHQGARRLGEQLVELNQELAEAQDRVLESQSMARLGEMAAGAAHEMNNPLMVISGRAQMLALRLAEVPKEREHAELIWRQADKLSDLITALRTFADPPHPEIGPVSVGAVLEEALHRVRSQMPTVPAPLANDIDSTPVLQTDGGQLATALSELLLNAYQSESSKNICVEASVDPLNGRFMLRVIDEGVGMDESTLAHAFDPFFSAKPAGRQVGLGLARARSLVEGLGGDLDLVSQVDRGTQATIRLPLSCDTEQRRSVEGIDEKTPVGPDEDRATEGVPHAISRPAS